MKIKHHTMIVATALLALAAGGVACAQPSRPGPIPAAPGGSEPRPAAPVATAPEVIPEGPPIAVSLEGFDAELDTMTTKHWIEERFATLKPPHIARNASGWPPPEVMPSAETKAYGDSLLAKLREPAEAAVQVALDPALHPSVRENAWHLLARLEEMAIPPLVEARFPDAEDRVRAATIAVEAELALRAKIAASLEPMLADRSLPVVPAPKPLDQMSSPEREAYHASSGARRTRFCDDAYLLMRSLHHPGPDRMTVKHDAEAYSSLSEAERDRVIQEARASRVYTRPGVRKP
jgi:hypothetical protein